MKTVTAIVASGGDDKNTVVVTVADGVSQNRVRFPRIGKFSTTDVDDVSTVFNSLVDGSSKVHLGEPTLAVVGEDGQYQTPAIRGNAWHGAVVLAPNETGDVSAVTGHGAAAGSFCNQGGESGKVSPLEAGVVLVYGAVENGNANAGVAKGMGPKRCETRDFIGVGKGGYWRKLSREQHHGASFYVANGLELERKAKDQKNNTVRFIRLRITRSLRKVDR